MSQMRRRRGVCATMVGLGWALRAVSAHAEGRPCFDLVRVIEIFPGAPGCPDAQYVVVELLPDPWGRGGWSTHLAIRDSCGDWTTVDPPVPSVDAGLPETGPPRRWLIGTPRAKDVFGIELDATAADLRFDPWQGYVTGGCSGTWYAGPAPAGQAFHFDGSGAQSFATPAPTNFAGAVGTFAGCSPDGGGPADGAVLPWPPERPDCSPPKVDAGAGGAGALRDVDAPPSEDAPTGAGGARGPGGASSSGTGAGGAGTASGGRHPTGAMPDASDPGSSSGDHNAKGTGTDDSGCSFTSRRRRGDVLPLVAALGVVVTVLRGRRGPRGAAR